MSQKTINFADNPYGAVLMDDYLAPLQNNMLTSNSGESRPEYVQQGTKWLCPHLQWHIRHPVCFISVPILRRNSHGIQAIFR